MKIKKILTSIMSAAIVITSIGSVAINAEEVTETEEKVYTLSELFDMSKEEFFALDNAQIFYDQIEYYSTALVMGKNHVLDCTFMLNTVTEPYVPFETEKQLKELIDIDGFKMFSPVLSPPRGYYDFNLTVYNDSYRKKYDDTETTISSDEDILEISKIWYCLQQVSSLGFYPPGNDLSSVERPYGEANEDGILNIMDASFIARKLAQQKGSELPETADFNADGEIDIRDAADIAQFMAARAAAQAEGWIE
ncbi:dockerin type I domain-containing protein [Porcipelethomonas sp.]|uniref:dockerin type I domain-containing protein n=1 Tax=Porcipelethomonas sp. TaxID=2981675 RepID=UPI003EF402DB